jgi:hypothetical protein
MADFYFRTIGQAWSAIVAAFTAANQLTYNAAGFTVTWGPGSSTYGRKFTVAGTAFVGDPPANGNYFAGEAKAGVTLPMIYVLSEPGFTDIPKVSVQGSAGALDLVGLLTTMVGAREACIADVTGATAVTVGTATLEVYSASVPTGEVKVSGWETDNDIAIDCWMVVDIQSPPPGPPLTQVPMPTYQTPASPVINNNIDVGPQLDTDVAINNGSVINTTVAKQFTGI